MKVTFLGTGTSTGVPVMMCDCKVCRSTDSKDKRLRSSVLIEDNGTTILIDCGPDFREQFLSYINRPVDGALITHHHYDHVGGIDDVRPISYNTPTDGFDIYCTEFVAADLRTKLPYCFSEHPYPGSPRLNLRVIRAGEAFMAGNLFVEPFTVMHGKLPILGFRIGRLAYITDALHLPESALEAISGAEVLIINALREREHPAHMNLNQALNVIRMTAPKRAFITHMSHEIGTQAWLDSNLPESVKAAYDGLTIEI